MEELPEAITKCDGSQKQLEAIRRKLTSACDEVLLRACFVAAVYKGYLQLVEFVVLQERIDVNSEFTSWYGVQTPLCCAISSGHKEVVCLLLAKGANIKMADQFGTTPLHWAAIDGQKEIVSILLENGADVQAEDKNGRTPLHCAAQYGHNGVVSILLEIGGAEIDAHDEEVGITCLHYAAGHGYTEIVSILLERGADIEAKDKDGYTALHYAAGNRHKDVVVLLLDRGADIESMIKDSPPFTYSNDVKALLQDVLDSLDTARSTLRNAVSADCDYEMA